MYLHIGNKKSVKKRDIIGIFDLDTSTVSKHTRDFLNKAEKEKRVFNVSFELPKSFILCCNKEKEQKVYISQISTATLNKRSNFERNDFK